jgi:hypothetical protein
MSTRDLYEQDLQTREFLMYYGRFGQEPRTLMEPEVSQVIINEQRTDVLKWFGDQSVQREDSSWDEEQQMFFFPLIPPEYKYWECVHPREWIVRFAGRIAALRNSFWAQYFKIGPKAKEDSHVVVVQFKHSEDIFCAGLVARAEQGKLIWPRPYDFSEAWRSGKVS